MSSTFAFTYTRTHTATYVSDHMRNVLRDIIRSVGLDPSALIDDWETIGCGIRTWLRSGHLENIILEIYRIGQSIPDGRMDFPIHYGGSGVDDDLWVDRTHLQRTLAKIDKVPANCRYRVVLEARPGYPAVEGFCDAQLMTTNGLIRRGAGTLVATPDVVAQLSYWKRK